MDGRGHSGLRHRGEPKREAETRQATLERHGGPRLTLESAERRLRAILERTVEQANENADNLIESGRRVAETSQAARQLHLVEADIKDLSQDPDDLTPYGRQSLKSARDFRTRIRHELAAIEEPYQTRAGQLNELAARAKRIGRRSEGLPGIDRLRALVEGAQLLDKYLTPAARQTVEDVRAGLESHRWEEPAEPDLAEPEQAGPVIALPPAPWEFTAPNLDLSSQPDCGEQALRAYSLNRAAQELSLVRGLNVLLTPQFARGLVQYPHQIQTARTVLRRMRGRALLCDEVGLGKTVEAGIVTREYIARGLARKILVLVPPSLVSQWQQEMLDKFDLGFISHDDPEFRRLGAAAWSQYDRIVASINTAKLEPHRERIRAQEFDLIVVDEAHHLLRNRGSLGWKFVNELPKQFVLLLTATPVQNDLEELFNLITLLAPGQLKTSNAFRREFVSRGDPRSPRNRERLRQLLAEVMIRNTRSQVHIAMPPRVAHTHRLNLSPEEAELYSALTSYARSRTANGTLDRMAAATLLREAGSSAPAAAQTLEGMAAKRRTDWAEVRHLAEAARSVERHTKAEQLCTLLGRRSDKTIVFTFYRETLRLLERALSQAGISFASLSGDNTAAEKDQAIAAFAADRRVLLSSDVGSEGRNLQFCRAMVNYDLPWNPMRIEQRVGRIHRIGQKSEVLIDNLCARRTVEDHILRILDEKLNMFELVVGEIGVILGNLETEQDFEEMALDIWTTASSDSDVDRGFNDLADRLKDARTRYREAQDLDEALFGDELASAGPEGV